MRVVKRALEKLSREECLRHLATAPVGRVVFTVGGLPAVEPVNYILDGERIVFRTREGAKLVAVREGTIVAFEVDEIDPATRTGWSVTVVGSAQVLADPEAERYRKDGPDPWVEGARDDVVVIEVAMVTGRRLTAATDDA